MNEVVPGVHIGPFESVGQREKLTAAGIRYVITVCDGERPELPLCISHHLHVPIEDESNIDILSWFDKTNAFIQQALDGDGGVLVHCVSGISRSAAVVMAYVMKSQELPCPKAFRILKKAHRPSCPNEGFRSQLKLFEAMGFRLDLDHPEYRLHKLQHIVDANMATLGEIPLAPAPIRGVTEYSTLLQCRKCRFRVAVDRNVLGHEPGAGQVAFRWRRRDLAEAEAGPRCSSLFVEPMSWMAPLVEEGLLQGKLCCPQCSSRFGNFNWAGLQCSCGCWVTPAFQINVSRIDCMAPPKKAISHASTMAAVNLAKPVTAETPVALEAHESAPPPAQPLEIPH